MDSQLNHLFEQARSAPSETKVKEVYKWMGLSVFTIALTFLFINLKKLILLKSVIMISSIATIVSVGAFILFTSGDGEMKNYQKEADIISTSSISNDSAELKFKQGSPAVASLDQNYKATPEIKKANNTPIRPVGVLPFRTQGSFNTSPQITIEKGQALTPKIISDLQNIGVFTMISIDGAHDIELIQGTTCSVKMKDGEEASGLKIVNDNGHLIINHEKASEKDEDQSYCCGGNFIITFVDLTKLSTNGASDIESEGSFNLGDFILKASGASDIDLTMTANKVELEISGANDVDMKGSADVLHVKNYGTSDLNSYGLKTKKATVKASGATDTKVHCSGDLTVNVSGVSSVKYTGNPSAVHAEASELSSCTKK
jgi:hypothetical protein